MRSRWSIGQRLGAGFAMLLLVLGTLAALTAWQLAQNDRAGEAVEAAIARTQRLDALERSLLLFAVGTRDAVQEPTPEQLGALAAAERRLDNAVRGVEAGAIAPGLTPLVTDYMAAARAAVAAGDLVRPRLVTIREAVLARTQAALREHDGVVASALQHMQANRRASRAVLLGGAAATTLLLLVIAFLTVRSVRVPARQLVGVATALRSGDWNPALALARGAGAHGFAPANEIAQIGHAFGAAALALELREQRLAAHAAVAHGAGASLDAAQIGEAVLRALMQHVNAEIGALFLPDPGTGLLVPVAARAVAAPLAPVRPGEGLVGQCARDGATVLWRDIPPDSPFSIKLGHDHCAPRVAAAIPVRFKGDLVGVLTLASLRPLDDGAVAFLEAAATQVGVGLANARTHEEIQQLLARVQAQGEEIQAQNEELQAQNEEIQAQNEELQAQGEEIQAQNDDLQRQSGQLHEQADALRQADARKNEFLGVLAHELRNPLAPIANCVALLGRKSGDVHAIGRAQGILSRQVRHLTHLIDDLLDVTRISRAKVVLNRERLNVIELVNQCLDDQREALAQHGIALKLDLPEMPILVEGDHTRLCQVFSNLLVNAVKFCTPGASVSVAVTLEAPERRVAIHVADTGEGIEPAFLSRIFEPFWQAHSDLARTRGGLGLGLALARGLVELHGGRIDARSAGIGCGAEFVVSLPLADAVAQPAGGAQAQVTPLPARQPLSARVLVVDDNADAASTLGELLCLEGCQVEIAHTASTGLEAALRFRPEAILCDIGLPVMNGYAFARAVRQQPELRSTLLVAITGYSAPADRAQAIDAGFDTHVAKPPDFALLMDILRDPAKGFTTGKNA